MSTHTPSSDPQALAEVEKDPGHRHPSEVPEAPTGAAFHPFDLSDTDRLDPPSAIAAWVSADPNLVDQCATAVDPLEVAARLETHGVSSRVAVESFGFPDVFTAAEAVYASLPFADPDPPKPPSKPMGGLLDLLRGALFALPALFLPVVVAGFAIHPNWWVLPVGLTVAWGVGQASATYAWALQGRNDRRSDALVVVASIVVSAALCFGFAALARRALGGSETSVVLAVGVAVYIAATGILVFQKAEWLLTACMVPAAVGSFLALGVLPVTVTHRAASWCVVATLVLVVLTANRRLLAGGWRRPDVGHSEKIRALKFLGYGVGCGLLISVFIDFAGEVDGTGGALIIAVWPLLVTLGLMEWQLRSFRSRATSALTSASDLGDFGHRVRFAFLWSVGLYVAALVALSAVGIVIGHHRHASSVPLLLASVGAIGISFFLALLLASSGWIDLVLECWVVAFAVLVAVLSTVYGVDGQITPVAGLIALLAASGTAILFLSVVSARALASPLSY
jgi:hypothetical protein